MAVFTYIAVDRGDLASGHSAATQYTAETPLVEWTPAIKRQKTVSKSLSGQTHTILHRIEKSYSFATLPTDSATLLASLYELFSSVAAGEEFTIDPYGTVAAPGTGIAVMMTGDVDIERVNQTEFKFSGRVEAV